jgi:cell wall-associated NlpC family hydrolase
MGVTLKDFPRDDSWWIGGRKNMYEDLFPAAGFKDGDRLNPEVGDVILMRYPTNITVANHAAIYTGNGEMMHHISNRISRLDSVVQYSKFIVRWLRYAQPIS